MSTTSASAHLGHLFTIGVLHDRSRNKRLSRATRQEAERELARYRDQGLILQQYGREEPEVATKKTRTREGKPIFTGQGILFAVIDDREKGSAGSDRSGKWSTVDVIAQAIDKALDKGKETPEEIAHYLVTSAFQHEPDRRVRFNSVLKAGDAVSAQLVRKLYNAYNELAELAEEEEDPKKKADIRNEATGFAEALNVVLSPFSVEDASDPRLVNWDEIDRIVDLFEKEQRQVRRERKGNPQ